MPWNYTSGLGNAAAFQVSGKPFLSGGLDCGPADSGSVRIDFPQVTRWISVSNVDANNTIKIGQSLGGLRPRTDGGGNYYELPAGSESSRLEIKCSTLYLSGSSNCSIMAGLTGIPSGAIKNNWDGTDGI